MLHSNLTLQCGNLPISTPYVELSLLRAMPPVMVLEKIRKMGQGSVAGVAGPVQLQRMTESDGEKNSVPEVTACTCSPKRAQKT